jgi:hypothetical protein
MKHLTSISCDIDMERHPLALPSFRIGMGARLLALLSLLLLGGAVHLQGQQQYTWAQSFGATSSNADGTPNGDPNYGAGYDTVVGISPMPDGGCVVAGQLDLPELYSVSPGAHTGGYADIALVRYSAAGTIIWQQMLRQATDSRQTHVSQMATDAAGNIYICGAKDSGAVPFVAKFNPAGALLWQNGVKDVAYNTAPPGQPPTYNLASVIEFRTMGLTADGGAVVATGDYTPYDYYSNTSPAIYKFNSDGSLAFHSLIDEVPGKRARYLGANAVCQSHDGTRYVALLPYNGGTTGVLLDSVGNIISAVAYTTNNGGGTAGDSPIQVIATPDGGYVALSVYNGGMVVSKLAPDLTAQFQKSIAPVFRGPSFTANNISLTDDGGYLIGGSVDSNAHPDPNALLMKLDHNGALEFVSGVGGPRNELGTIAFEASDQGYFFATTTFSYSTSPNAGYAKPDWWIVKTDPNRHLQNFDGVMEEVPLNLFTSTDLTSIGPTSDFIRIDGVNPEMQTQPALIFENTALNSPPNLPTVLTQGVVPPLPPVHGGLSTTIFRVNGSDSPTVSVCDTVLSFAAIQTGTPAGLIVRVQFTTTPTPNDATNTSWTNLPNGTGGSMVYDPADQEFILTSANYPLVSNVYFRAISAGSAYQDSSISNFVGPFDVTSTKPQIGSTRLDFTGNGNIADLYFRASESATVTGMSVRVQASTTPGDECSWSDLSNGTMTQSTDPKQLLLLVNNYPTTKGVCFRAIASASGYADSISNTMGPFDITAVIPPAVTVTTANPLPGSGDGHDPDHPIIVAVDNGAFAVTVQSTRALKTVQLQVSGLPVTDYPGSSDPNAVYIAYFTPTIGLHVYEGVAINDLRARARAGSGAIYVRVVPSSSAAKAERTTGADAAAAAPAGHIYRVVNSGGEWNASSTWSDENNNPGVPGEKDLAIIGSSTIRCSFDVVAGSVTLGVGGVIIGPGTFDVYGTITLLGGSFQNSTLDVFGTANLLNPQDVKFGGTLINHGTFNVHGSGGLLGADVFSNDGTVNWLTPLQIPLNAATDPAAALRILQANSVTGNGVLTGGLTALVGNDGSSLIGNDGATLVASGGGNLVASGGGNLVASGGGNLVASGGGNLVATGGGNLVASGGGNLVATGGGNLVASGGGNFQPTARMKAATAAAAPGYTQNSGETNLSACTIVGPVTLNGGVLSGTGFIQGDLTNNGGYISTGHSPGVMAVIGNFAQSANGTLIIKKGGPSPSQFDQLQVGGVASLGGKLDIKTINGYTPDPADTFCPLGFGSVSGTFASVSSNAQVTVNASGLLTSVDPTKPNPTNGQPLNIATRLQIQSGDNLLIGGFIITGPAGSTKKVLIRGIGPSLANFGVAGTIPDPFLELHNPDGSVVSNDNWKQAPNVAEIPSGFAPTNDLESIIYTTLSPGNYTAILKGAHGEAGVGLVEAYDFDTASTAKLANIATRGFVNTGDNVMIGGFIIGGTEPANVLVRAIGPSLIPFVQGALQATTLELHDANGGVISNEGWRNTQESEIQATTIPPTNDNEAAILATLVPGNYTAIVRGKNDTTGIAVVEAYNLQ